MPLMVIDRPHGQTWLGAGGEVNLHALRVMKRRYVLWFCEGFMPEVNHRRGMQQGRSALCQEPLVWSAA